VQNPELKKTPGDVRQTLVDVKQAAARSADRETSRLIDWVEQLNRFRARLAASEEDKLFELFLVQRDVDKMVRTEQEREKERKRVDQEAEKRGSLNAEMAEIVKWAEDDRLPVVAPVLDRFRVRDINAELDPQTHRIVRDETVFAELPTKDYRFKENQIVTQSEYEGAVEELKKRLGDQAEEIAARAAPPTRPMEGRVVYSAITLLPGVKFTLPLLLLVLTIWLAWRVVNLPTFGDFLIATEAELNKVSWTTRARLWQDTLVVLTTMLLMALFLFVVDIAWGKILSWNPIGVLQVKQTTEKPKDEANLKW